MAMSIAEAARLAALEGLVRDLEERLDELERLQRFHATPPSQVVQVVQEQHEAAGLPVELDGSAPEVQPAPQPAAAPDTVSATIAPAAAGAGDTEAPQVAGPDTGAVAQDTGAEAPQVAESPRKKVRS